MTYGGHVTAVVTTETADPKWKRSYRQHLRWKKPLTVQWQSHSGRPVQSNYLMLHCKRRVLRVNNHNIRTCHSAEIGITAKLKQTQAEMNLALLWRSEKHRKWKERYKIQRSEFIWIHLRCFNRSAFSATVPQSSVGGARVIRRATARTRWNTCVVQRKEQEQGRELKNLNTDCHVMS